MLAQILVGSVASGAVYALIALGFVLIYKGTGVVHFGYGDQVTFGAYMVIVSQSFMGMGFTPGVIFALVISGLLGVLIFYCFMRPLRHASLWSRIIATLAIGLALREGLRAVMGPGAWPFPFLLPPESIEIGGLYIVPASMAIVGVALLVLAALYLYLEKTLQGRAIIAACENRIGASLVGIGVDKVFLWIWVVASVLAAVAGILVAPQLTLSPEMGFIAIKGFTAAVLGGFASLPGAVIGGILLGILEGLAGVMVGSALKDLVSYVVLILVMILMPHGLLGKLTVKKV